MTKIPRVLRHAAESVLALFDRLSQGARRRQGAALLWESKPKPLDRAISAAYFSLAAPVWRGRGVTEEHLAPFIAGLERVARPQRILDIGTGTGASAAAAAERFPSADVNAFDRSRRMIQLARETYSRSNLSFFVGESESLPFEDGSFDLICMLNATPHPGELNRVTTDDARVLLASSFFDVPGAAWFERWEQIGWECLDTADVARGHWQLFKRGRAEGAMTADRPLAR